VYRSHAQAKRRGHSFSEPSSTPAGESALRVIGRAALSCRILTESAFFVCSRL
jgi:hypothetical protein